MHQWTRHVRVELGGNAIGVGDDHGANLLDAEARHPFVRALEPIRVFTVVLQEPTGEP
jgi:hypothetical protein